MNRNRRVSVVCRVALPILAALVASLLPAFAAEFKATLIVHESGQPKSIPLVVKGSKYRLDREEKGEKFAVIVGQKAGVILSVNHARKMYAEIPVSQFGAAFLDPLQAIELTARMGFAERKALGTETVSGYLCDKYALLPKEYEAEGRKYTPAPEEAGKPVMTYWVAQKLNFPIKIATEGQEGFTAEVTNIQEGPVEEALFQIPAGFESVGQAGSPSPPAPDWAAQVSSAASVVPPHQRRMSAGEIIRVKVLAGQEIKVSGEGETENQEDATFTAVAFRDGKPIQDPSYTTSTASKGTISTFGFDNTPEEADEIVVRVNEGVVLIGVKQCGLEEMTVFDECPDLPELPDWVREVASAPVVRPPHQQRMSAGEIIRIKVEAGKQIDVAGRGETDNPEDANFNLVPFSGGRPTEAFPPGSESYYPYPALGSPVHLRGESRMEEGADEIVVRVNKGVVLIEVKQCGFETVVRKYCPGWPE